MNPEEPNLTPRPVETGTVPAPVAQASPAAQLASNLKAQIGRVFLGQRVVLDQVVAALFAGGHVLLEGKPGLGKTHLVLAMARAIGGEFRRIQFTPDLMPSDVTGHTLYDMGSQSFRVRRGPVFTNLLLADEINRAPAKTQSALLEVMQESRVTIDGETHSLQPPFMTFATQNPIEQEGTYPLPEAQLDRFLLKVLIDYPDPGDEEAIVTGASAGGAALSASSLEEVCSPADIIAAQAAVSSVQAVPEVVRYAVAIARATRTSPGISLGAGTRGAIGLVKVAKAYAAMAGREYITPDDVKAAAPAVLRHRVTVAPELAISGQDVNDSITAVLKGVEAPRG